MVYLNNLIENDAGLFLSDSVTAKAVAQVSPPYMLNFASAYVTANFAYTLTDLKYQGTLDTSVPITLFNRDKSSSQYLVTPLVDMPKALNGYILTEATPSSDTVKIKVCFRGVQLSDFDSVKRAVEMGGPGIQGFMAASDSIIKQIETITKQYTSVELEFTGHSLGGADATNCLHDFLYHYVDQGQFQNVQAVTLNTLNAPGDYLNNKDSFSQLLSANKYNSAPLDVAINIAISDADVISQFGENAFSEIPSNLATVQVLHVDKIVTNPDSTWGEFFSIIPDIIKEMIYIGHALEPIFSYDKTAENELSSNFSYDYFNNQTETSAKQINEILTYKWHLTSAINFLASMSNNMIDASKLLWYASKGVITGTYDDTFCDLYADLYANTQNEYNNNNSNSNSINSSEIVYNLSVPSIQPPIELVASVFE